MQDASRRLELRGEAPFDPLGERLLPEGALSLKGEFDLADLTSLPLTIGQARIALAGALGVRFDLSGEWARVLGSASVEGNDLALVSPNGTALFGPARLSARVDCGEETTSLSEILLQAPGQQRLIRNRKRQTYNNDITQGLLRDIHPLPKTIRAE